MNEPTDWVAAIKPIPNLIKGDPEDLVHVDWSDDVELDESILAPEQGQ